MTNEEWLKQERKPVMWIEKPYAGELRKTSIVILTASDLHKYAKEVVKGESE